ncbi:MAG: hypothetical protein ACJ71P_01750 [Nitrososphaeraceae archaeon]
MLKSLQKKKKTNTAIKRTSYDEDEDHLGEKQENRRNNNKLSFLNLIEPLKDQIFL